jgi:hypothetical protein
MKPIVASGAAKRTIYCGEMPKAQAIKARREADAQSVRMPDGRVLRDPRWDRIAEKYERAARYPWLPVPPDPPPPE